ncbi:hypothetical protein BUALT_Bualt14G0102300 [Buddleja alternifolia]|uniref:Uncharacterized protein n=1 Tax=Buddleja alternifolia TaxID=168488 RepID=A0AAV6WPZ0_9LAMI|nr:hypothetical protein BUALT_Bualt14G0102300 [Buddleja alternifolia]
MRLGYSFCFRSGNVKSAELRTHIKTCVSWEGSIRSGGGVLKKKSSSGCLIIKKKGEIKNSVGGVGGSSVNCHERKRARLVVSDSGASDDGDEDESLEFMRRKVSGKR